MDNPQHPDPAQELPPPPEEKLLPAHAEAGTGKHNKWTMVIVAIIIVALLEVVSIYFLRTESDVKFIQSFFGTSPTTAPTTIPQPSATSSTSSGLTPTYSMPETSTESGAICPADAMQCPDGSYVGRTGPECKFVCPQ